jgi:hypothetical protein
VPDRSRQRLNAARPRESRCIVRRIVAVTGDLADAQRLASEIRTWSSGCRAEVRQRRIRSGSRVDVVLLVLQLEVHYEHDWIPVDERPGLSHCTTCHRIQARAAEAPPAATLPRPAGRRRSAQERSGVPLEELPEDPPAAVVRKVARRRSESR